MTHRSERRPGGEDGWDAGQRPIGPDTVGASHGMLTDGVAGHADLQRWAADAMVDEAALARSRERWLRLQADEDGTFGGALLDLADRGRPVTLDVGTRRLRGLLVGIGVDFVVLRGPSGNPVLVRTTAIEVLQAEPGAADAAGDRTERLDIELAAIMGPVAADRPDVSVTTLRGTTVRGRLRSAGRDVIRLRNDADTPAPVWIPLASIATVTIDP